MAIDNSPAEFQDLSQYLQEGFYGTSSADFLEFLGYPNNSELKIILLGSLPLRFLTVLNCGQDPGKCPHFIGGTTIDKETYDGKCNLKLPKFIDYFDTLGGYIISNFPSKEISKQCCGFCRDINPVTRTVNEI